MKTSPSLSLLSLGLLIGFSGCAQEDKFVYYSNQEDLRVTREVKVKEVHGDSGVDILWVVDNSGSMMDPQQNVIDNAELFMREFIKNKIDWKLGIVSTDEDENPYLGFGANLFNYLTLNPIDIFTKAVGKLGTSGSATEKTFQPILSHLQKYPDFVRQGTAVAVIMVTDAEEQSGIKATQFISKFKALVGANRNYYSYGVFAAEDLGCYSSEGRWDYAGSPYESFVKSAKGGKVYPLCTPDFGTALADMGRDIAKMVRRSSIYLSVRPNSATIRVVHKGRDLPGGPQEDGGIWYYDYGMNAVTFYSLDFSTELEDSVNVSFDRI